MFLARNVLIFLFSAWLSVLPALAQDLTSSVMQAIPVGPFSVGIGSTVNLKSSDSAIAGPAIFVGSTVFPDKNYSYQLYLNKLSRKLFYIQASHFSKINPNQQTVLDSYQQAGGTCSAYAINNFLQQMDISGFQGSGELKKLISNEEGRTFLLADAINEYYLTLSHRYSLRGILNKYGKAFGFTCSLLKTDSYLKAKATIMKNLNIGSPVILSYNIGPEMVKGPFPLELYDQSGPKLDERLWIPRRVGERNSGGHTIVAVGSFVENDKTYLVMIDSDWSEPRIWDMDQYLNHQKTALEEVEFVSCK